MALTPTTDVTIRGKDETKAAFDSSARNAESFGQRAKDAINKPFEILKGLLALEVARWFGDIARSSVESASNAAAAMGRVESAVTNLGISFTGTSAELNRLFAKIQDTTRFSDDDAATAFANLVTISGDYAGSVKNLGLVTDLAAAKQLDLKTASDLVGKVMAGETSTLKRYGIVVKDGADAITAMRERFNGFAERDAGTLSGRLQQVANAVDNIKEAIGRALTGDAGSNGMSAFAHALNDIGTWIDQNSSSVHAFADDMVRIATAAAKMVTSGGPALLRPATVGDRVLAIQNHTNAQPALNKDDALDAALAKPDAKTQAEIERNKRQAAAERATKAAEDAAKAEAKHLADLKSEYDLLKKISDLTGLDAAQREKQQAIEVEMRRAAFNPNSSDASRGTALDFVNGVDAARAKQTDEFASSIAPIDAAGKRLFAQPIQTISAGPQPITARATAAALPVSAGSSSFGSGVAASFVDQMGGPDAFKGIDDSFGKFENHIESFTGGTMANFFGAWEQGIGDVITGHERLGAAVLSAARKAIGGAMAAEGKQTLFKAAIAAAEGFTNPAEFLKAGELLAIGTAELAAAAALGGGGGGGGPGGGGGGGSLSAGGFQQSQNDASNRPKVTVVLPGKKAIIDARDPDDLNALRDAMAELSGTRDIEFLFQD